MDHQTRSAPEFDEHLPAGWSPLRPTSSSSRIAIGNRGFEELGEPSAAKTVQTHLADPAKVGEVVGAQHGQLQCPQI